MNVQLKPSSLEKGMFELIVEGTVDREIFIPFLTPKMHFPNEFVSLEEFEEWLKNVELKFARKKVYWLLGARNYPSVQLLRKLKESGYSDSVSELVVEEVKSLGYVQDEEFVSGAIEREFRKGYGPRYIEQKLRSKGLPADEVRRLITSERQKERALEWMKKQKKLDRSKLTRSLQQRGFDFEIIRQVIG